MIYYIIFTGNQAIKIYMREIQVLEESRINVCQSKAYCVTRHAIGCKGSLKSKYYRRNMIEGQLPMYVPLNGCFSTV